MSLIDQSVLSSILSSLPQDPQSMGPQDPYAIQGPNDAGPVQSAQPSPLIQAAILGAMHGAASSGAHPLVGLHGLLQGAMTSFNPGGNQALQNPDASSDQAPKSTPVQPSDSSMFPNLAVSYKAPQIGGSTPSLPVITPPTAPTITPPTPTTPSPVAYQNPNIPSKDDYAPDPKVQDLRDAASHLMEQSRQLQPPKHPGMSLIQALVGIAGAVATQNNPKAQFVANYLPSLGKAIEDKYGDSMQAWQVARQELQGQAQSMLSQAADLEKTGLSVYQTNTGYYGKTGVAGINAGAKVSAANIAANSRALGAAAKTAGDTGKEAVRLMLSGAPGQVLQGMQMLQGVSPTLKGWTPDQLQEISTQLNPKELLEGAQANFKNVTAQPTADNLESGSNLKDSQANQIDTLLPARLAAMDEIPGLTKARAAELAQKTALMGPLAAATIGRAASYADMVKGTNQFHTDQTALGYAGLNQKANAEAQMNIRSGMDTLHSQSDSLRNEIGKLTSQFAATKDATQKGQLGRQIDAFQNALNGYQAQYGELADTVKGLGQSYGQTQQAPNPAPNPASQAPSPVLTPGPVRPSISGPIGGPGGSSLTITPDKPKGAVAQANLKAQQGNVFDPSTFVQQVSQNPKAADQKQVNDFNLAIDSLKRQNTQPGSPRWKSVWTAFAKMHGLTYAGG